jgi:hypothetical protein
LRSLALSPLASLATTNLLAMWSEQVTGSVGVALTATIQVALGVAGAVIALRDWRTRSAAVAGWKVVAIAASAVSVLVLLILGLSGAVTYTPNDDGIRHATILSRLLDVRTLDAAALTPGDLLTGSLAESYYPTGLHVSAGIVSQLSGVAPSTALMICSLGAVGVAFPAGSALLALRLTSDGSAASFASIVALTAPAMSLAVLWWGGLPLLVATCATPALIEAALSKETSTLRTGIALMLMSCGIFVTQTGQWLIVIGVAVLGAATQLWIERASSERTSASRIGWLLAGPVLAAPTLPAVVAQGRERAADEGFGTVPPIRSLGELLQGIVLPSPVGATYLLLAALVGAILCLARKRAIFAVMLMSLTFVIPVLMTGTGVLGDLAGLPFYGVPRRVAPLAALWLPTLAGVALAAAWSKIKAPGPSVSRPELVGLAAVVAVTGSVLAMGAWSTIYTVGSVEDRVAFVSEGDRQAFTWLAENLAPDQRVLNDRDDMSRWAYVTDRVPTVHGIKPAYGWIGPEWEGATAVLQALPGGVDPEVQRGLDQLSARYVITSERSLNADDSLIAPSNLRGACGLDEVFASGDVAIFEVSKSPCGEQGT